MDGKGPIEGTTFSMPIERKAPGVLYSQPVAMSQCKLVLKQSML